MRRRTTTAVPSHGPVLPRFASDSNGYLRRCIRGLCQVPMNWQPDIVGPSHGGFLYEHVRVTFLM